MRILNLYGGTGGNRQKWTDCYVTTVENNPAIAFAYRQMYPQDNCIIADAHEFLVEHFKEFDFIWSSPPCPTRSRLVTAKTGWGIYEYPDMRLYQEIIFLQHFFKGYWVVENVISYYDPLIPPTATLDRHYFWTNFAIGNYSNPQTFNHVRHKKELLADYHGIQLPKGTKDERKLLRNAVSPALGEHIFNYIPRPLITQAA